MPKKIPGISERSRTRLTIERTEHPQKISFTFRIDESVVAEMKLLHIRPSAIVDRELRREISRRKRLLKSKTKAQVVNRFSGEVLSSG